MFQGGMPTALSWLMATLATARAAFLRYSGRKGPVQPNWQVFGINTSPFTRLMRFCGPQATQPQLKAMTTTHFRECVRYHFLLSLFQMAPWAHCSLSKRDWGRQSARSVEMRHWKIKFASVHRGYYIEFHVIQYIGCQLYTRFCGPARSLSSFQLFLVPKSWFLHWLNCSIW